MTIWLTRPRDDSQRMADMLEQHGIKSIVAPLMDIMPHQPKWPVIKPQAILLSSRYGAAALGTLPASWHDLPVYCVGPATALMAQQHGFNHIFTGEEGTVALLPKLRAALKSGDRLLYPCGEDVKVDVDTLLRPDGIVVERVVAYLARGMHALPPVIVEALRNQTLQGVILCSPRTVQIAKELLEAQNLLHKLAHVDIYCLSLDIAAATATAELDGRSLHACPIPTYEAMMELLSEHAIAEL